MDKSPCNQDREAVIYFFTAPFLIAALLLVLIHDGLAYWFKRVPVRGWMFFGRAIKYSAILGLLVLWAVNSPLTLAIMFCCAVLFCNLLATEL